jgi:hypothetical protein
MGLLKSENFIEDPLVRQAMKKHCLKTMAELDAYEQKMKWAYFIALRLLFY